MDTGTDPRIERALQRIHGDCIGLHIRDIARDAYISISHFYRLFRQATGMTPTHFIRQVQLTRACDLLTKTDLSVKEVSTTVGFTDSGHFIRTFRSHFGVTPRQFHRQIKQRRTDD